ncbi:MAG: acetyl-CoA decarbonylase/synthase complex subunit gamma [Nitrospiraceae bacterium]|nr:acetyl-CoA decarbonylase/synthase complex subunit gamma [Nitrospiraceae bacterium]
MALSGLDIYKHLPKENCKECGLATCLAFAMKVAGGQATLDACPRLDDGAKAALGEASAPPQQLVTIGSGDHAVKIGQETVLFRHDDKFYHPCAVAICVDDTLDGDAMGERCKAIGALSFDRMGTTSAVGLLALHNTSGDVQRFAQAAKAAAVASDKPLVLISPDADALRAAGEATADGRPLLWIKDAVENGDAAIAVAKDLSLPLCLEAPDFDSLAALAEKARDAGLKELVLSPGPVGAAEGLSFLSQSRRAAIEKKFRPMGFPVAMVAMGEDPVETTVDACWYTLKYAGIIVTNLSSPEQLLAVLTTRQDIYTNPQVPVQVEPGLHTIGDPGADAPVLVTTNFALSYYSVESEVESSRIPAYVLAVDTEGTSVLTAWAAEKLTAATITEALTQCGVGGKIDHKKLILPGLVAVLSGSVADESGWEILVGPREASGIVSYLKNQWKP